MSSHTFTSIIDTRMLLRALGPLFFLTIGAALIVLPTAWSVELMWSTSSLATIGATLVALGSIGVVRFQGLRIVELPPDDDYYLHCMITGLALSCFSAIGLSVVAGLAYSNVISIDALPDPLAAIAPRRTPESPLSQSLHIVVSGGLSLVGVAFYIAQSVRKKVAPEDFHRGKFWSGLFFRTGEAVIFTTVFILFDSFYVSRGEDPVFGPRALPVLGLVMGMFVKSGEAVVFGLATNLFHLAHRLLPGAQPGEPSNKNAAAEKADPRAQPESAESHPQASNLISLPAETSRKGASAEQVEQSPALPQETNEDRP